MPTVNLYGSEIFGIAITEALGKTPPDHLIRVETHRDPQDYDYIKTIRFLDAKSGALIGELTNAYHGQ